MKEENGKTTFGKSKIRSACKRCGLGYPKVTVIIPEDGQLIEMRLNPLVVLLSLGSSHFGNLRIPRDLAN